MQAVRRLLADDNMIATCPRSVSAPFSTPSQDARRRLRRLVIALARSLVHATVSTSVGLRTINAMHGRMTPRVRHRFHERFGVEPWPVEGRWTARFCLWKVTLPLHRDFPLSWPSATSFQGEDDIEIHAFYERLLGSPEWPRVCFDVGANYGFHSLKFLVAGVRTISFEPNPACHAYLRECAALNGVRCEIHQLALGDEARVADLWIPDERTYRATVVPEVTASFNSAAVSVIKVRQITLDQFVAERGVVPDLVKIDTEGNELAVLRGARTLLTERQPMIVFESWPGHADRPAIFRLLASHGYRVHALTDPPSDNGPSLTLEAFVDAPANDFVATAVPRDLG